MKYREVIKIIEDDGWTVSRQRGSHRVYKHSQKLGIVIVAGHKLSDEVPKDTKRHSEASGLKVIAKL